MSGQRASIPSLTGIRGFAALWVLLFHVQMSAPDFGLPLLGELQLLRNGWVGVDVFFVLSGFVLFHVHAAGFESITARGLAQFAWLRVFRIYPLATLVLMLIVLLVALDPGFAAWYPPGNLTAVAFLKTLLLATRWIPPFHGDWNQPVWSLSVEIVGYCAFPWLAFALIRARREWALILIALAGIAAPMLLAVLAGVPPDDIFEWAILRMAGCFVAGMALCRLWQLWPALPPRLVGRASLAAIAAIAVLACTRAGALVDFPFAALILLLAYQSGPVNRVLASRVALFFGAISFPLYLLHVMPLTWLRYAVARGEVAAPLAGVALLALVAALIGLAFVLHRLVEAPIHRWARRNLPGGDAGESARPMPEGRKTPAPISPR